MCGAHRTHRREKKTHGGSACSSTDRRSMAVVSVGGRGRERAEAPRVISGNGDQLKQNVKNKKGWWEKKKTSYRETKTRPCASGQAMGVHRALCTPAAHARGERYATPGASDGFPPLLNAAGCSPAPSSRPLRGGVRSRRFQNVRGGGRSKNNNNQKQHQNRKRKKKKTANSSRQHGWIHLLRVDRGG